MTLQAPSTIEKVTALLYHGLFILSAPFDVEIHRILADIRVGENKNVLPSPKPRGTGVFLVPCTSTHLPTPRKNNSWA